MKNVWITALGRETAAADAVICALKRYGLGANGAFWNDNLDELGWLDQAANLIDPAISLWIVLGTAEQCAMESVAYGLSLLSLYVGSRRGTPLPALHVIPGDDVTTQASLPAVVASAGSCRLSDSSFPARAVARANMPLVKVHADHRIGVHAHKAAGVWFETGPGEGKEWEGAMFGTDIGTIDFHAVGPAGGLPEKSVLEFPRRGIRLESGNSAYTSWAVQNRFDGSLSYYVRVRGIPARILFGPYSSDDEADVTILNIV